MDLSPPSHAHAVVIRGIQMVLAIESCHKHGFIHRDIKPDVGIDSDHRTFSVLSYGPVMSRVVGGS